MIIDKKFKEALFREMGPLTFAMFLRVVRDSMGLTQAELGRKLGVSRSNICDIEKGRQLVGAALAIKVARKAGFPEKMALKACLQDQVRKAGSDALVAVS